MKLFIMRHATAGEPKDDPEEERARGLDETGQQAASAVGAALRKADPTPKVVLSSNYARTLQTGDQVARELGVDSNPVDELAPHSPIRSYIKSLLDNDNSKRVLIVGHSDNLDPLLEDDMKDDSGPLFKGEVRCYRVDRDDLGSAELLWRIRPSDVGFPDVLE